MTNLNAEREDRDSIQKEAAQKVESLEKTPWETPKMEDVSEQVMAQPYIRFT
jgi:hypothetical protein